jgi:hypothetical protein
MLNFPLPFAVVSDELAQLSFCWLGYTRRSKGIEYQWLCTPAMLVVTKNSSEKTRCTITDPRIYSVFSIWTSAFSAVAYRFVQVITDAALTVSTDVHV